MLPQHRILLSSSSAHLSFKERETKVDVIRERERERCLFISVQYCKKIDRQKFRAQDCGDQSLSSKSSLLTGHQEEEEETNVIDEKQS